MLIRSWLAQKSNSNSEPPSNPWQFTERAQQQYGCNMTPAQKSVGKKLRARQITPKQASVLFVKLAIAYRATAEAALHNHFGHCDCKYCASKA